MGDLTAHFSRKEFACHGIDCCGHSAPVNAEMVDGLERLWKIVDMHVQGTPKLIISSGFRCIAHNKEIRGAEHSKHCFGYACDVICPDGLTVDQFYDIAELVPCFAYGGIGRYGNRLHLDVRKNGPARWDERK